MRICNYKYTRYVGSRIKIKLEEIIHFWLGSISKTVSRIQVKFGVHISLDGLCIL